MLKMATNALVSPTSLSVQKPNSMEHQVNSKRSTGIIVECPKCNEYIGVIPTNGRTEFPCPYCGTEGYLDVVVS
jgi:hypothetical protein